VKPLRNIHKKIPDIKRYRQLSNLLWRLHAPTEQADHHFPWEQRGPWYLGLKDAKDLVERMFVYVDPVSSPNIDRTNLEPSWLNRGDVDRIALIKRVRAMLKMVNKLGVKMELEAWGLRECKDFVLRLYPYHDSTAP
jgi:hypothetical protein